MPPSRLTKSSNVSEDDTSLAVIVTPAEPEPGRPEQSADPSPPANTDSELSDGQTRKRANPVSETSPECQVDSKGRKKVKMSKRETKSDREREDSDEGQEYSEDLDEGPECSEEDASSEEDLSSGEDTSNEEELSSSENMSSEEETDSEEGKIEVGMLAESKEFYGHLDSKKRRTWKEKPPSDLDLAAENQETRKYAVIVRKVKPIEVDSTKTLTIDSIVVQSPYLKKILSDILKGYPGIITEVTRLVIEAPFACFIHRWEQFTDALHDETLDPATRDHLKLLLDILKQEMGDLIQLREDYVENRVVSFQHAWTVFAPGCLVFGLMDNKPTAVKFKRGSYQRIKSGNIYSLEAKMVDWDGIRMGWVDVELQIPEYEGTRPFTELPCYPLEYHEDPESMEATLRERGRRFDDLAGFHYKAYKGTAIWHPRRGRKSVKESVESRIVIDGVNWEKNNPENAVWLTELHLDVMTHESEPPPVSPNTVVKDFGDPVERPKLTDDQLIVTSPIVRGYSLRNKRWMKFFIDEVKEVDLDEEAFDSLVLPMEHKELILAFAQSQAKYKDSFDDIIAGKGKGIIILLSGGPGIGKTLTAESVADKMKVPLYVMSAGDLGTYPFELEESLTQILAVVAAWNAVLLLDECDVFLEARGVHEMHRNQIVSIFLRTLEYYEGILFLTTNRASNIDPAFQSRIHLSLEYPSLDTQARLGVWRTFLDKTVGLDKDVRGKDAHELTEKQILKLGNLNLNGRQIKNVLKTANLLACHKGEKLSHDHV